MTDRLAASAHALRWLDLVMSTRGRVLVVDDDGDQLETLCRGLLYVGIHCIPARTAAEALALLTGATGEHINLLLADLSASGKPGTRLVEQVRNLRPDLPVLVVTGLVLSWQALALEARGIPILQKPFTPDQLGRAIQTALTSNNEPKGETK